MRITSRRKAIAFFLVLGICLVAAAVALNVAWIIRNWRDAVLLFFGVIFFAAIILGMILNTGFLVREIRAASSVPLVVFSYFNPIFQMGLERFAQQARAAGADGALVTDLPPEDSSDYLRAMLPCGLDTIFLAAPTTSDSRMRRIAEVSSGFLYVISRTGVTGEREALADELPSLLRRARQATTLPIAVGFGISLPGHVSMLGGLADAAVVGSALVAEVERANSADQAAANVAARVRVLKEAGRRGMSRREPQEGQANLPS
jgi:tryptophan synthase alpha chain